MPDEGTGAAPGTAPEGGQVPEPAAPVPAQPAAAGQGAGPWAADLETRFQDPEQRAAVDQYLREVWQPRVTQLEQTAAEARTAKELYDDFNNDPLNTYLAITTELFDDQRAEAILRALDLDNEPQGTPGTPAAPAQPAAQGQPSTPEVPSGLEDVVAYVRAQQAREYWSTNMDNVVKQNAELLPPGEDPVAQRALFEKMYSPFVVANEGNFAAATQAYKDWWETVKHTVAPVPPAAPETPPPTLGSQTAAPQGTPPVQTEYNSVGDAIDAMFREDFAPAPPVMGGV